VPLGPPKRPSGCAPDEYANSSLDLKRGAKPASRASADVSVQEHRSKEVAHSGYRVNG